MAGAGERGREGGREGGQGQKNRKKEGQRKNRAEQQGGDSGSGGDLLVKETRMHLKVNRNSLTLFRGTAVTLGLGGGDVGAKGPMLTLGPLHTSYANPPLRHKHACILTLIKGQE